jgi:hypothetical protein
MNDDYVTIWISTALHHALKIRAAQEQRTMIELADAYIAHGLTLKRIPTSTNPEPPPPSPAPAQHE